MDARKLVEKKFSQNSPDRDRVRIIIFDPKIYGIINFNRNVRLGFHVAQTVKTSAYNVEGLSLIPRSGRSPGEGKGNPLQYTCLENSMDRGAW